MKYTGYVTNGTGGSETICEYNDNFYRVETFPSIRRAEAAARQCYGKGWTVVITDRDGYVVKRVTISN